MREKIVIALGGNALQSGKEAATAEAQLKTVKETAERSQKSVSGAAKSPWSTATVRRWGGYCWLQKQQRM